MSSKCVDETSGADLVQEVTALLAPRWPFYRDRLRAATGGSAEVSFERLVRPGELSARLAAFARSQPHQDRRGMASLWLQWYLVTAWPPVLTAVLLLERSPLLEPARSALVLDAEGRPEALALEPDATAVEQGTDALLHALAYRQAAPLIAGMSRAAGMAPRVGWSNAANVLGWFLVEAAAMADPARLAPGWRLLRARQRPDGGPNPLHVTDLGRALSPDTRPPRRVCCLRYRLTDHPYCADCPIPDTRRQ